MMLPLVQCQQWDLVGVRVLRNNLGCAYACCDLTHIAAHNQVLQATRSSCTWQINSRGVTASCSSQHMSVLSLLSLAIQEE